MKVIVACMSTAHKLRMQSLELERVCRSILQLEVP